MSDGDLAERAADRPAQGAECDEDANGDDGQHDGVFSHRLPALALRQQVELERKVVQQLGPPRSVDSRPTPRRSVRITDKNDQKW